MAQCGGRRVGRGRGGRGAATRGGRPSERRDDLAPARLDAAQSAMAAAFAEQAAAFAAMAAQLSRQKLRPSPDAARASASTRGERSSCRNIIRGDRSEKRDGVETVQLVAQSATRIEQTHASADVAQRLSRQTMPPPLDAAQASSCELSGPTVGRGGRGGRSANRGGGKQTSPRPTAATEPSAIHEQHLLAPTPALDIGTTLLGPATSHDIEFVQDPDATLRQLICDALEKGQRSLVLSRAPAPDVETSIVVLPSGFSLEGAVSLDEPVKVNCRCVRILPPPPTSKKFGAPISNESQAVVAVLRRIRLDGSSSSGGSCSKIPATVLVDPRARVILEDCEVRSASTGVLLQGQGSVARLQGCRITAAETGIFAGAGASVEVCTCSVLDCGADGLRLEPSVQHALIRESIFLGNGCNGALLGSASLRAARGRHPIEFVGNSFARNGQYGIWTELGARSFWRANWLEGNALGERGGTGLLDGWQDGQWLRQGEACSVWLEDHGRWSLGMLQGDKLPAANEADVEVSLSDDHSGKPSSNEKVKIRLVPRRALRPLCFTEVAGFLPPIWSSHGPCRAQSAYQHYVQLRGLAKGSVEVRRQFDKLPPRALERAAAEAAARADRRRYQVEVEALRQARAGANVGPCAIAPREAVANGTNGKGGGARAKVDASIPGRGQPSNKKRTFLSQANVLKLPLTAGERKRRRPLPSFFPGEGASRDVGAAAVEAAKTAQGAETDE